MYYIGISRLGAGHVGVGTFVAFSTYLSMFWGPVRNLASYYNKLVTNLSAAERIFEVLDMQTNIKEKDNAYELPEENSEKRYVSFLVDHKKDWEILRVTIEEETGIVETLYRSPELD